MEKAKIGEERCVPTLNQLTPATKKDKKQFQVKQAAHETDGDDLAIDWLQVSAGPQQHLTSFSIITVKSSQKADSSKVFISRHWPCRNNKYSIEAQSIGWRDMKIYIEEKSPTSKPSSTTSNKLKTGIKLVIIYGWFTRIKRSFYLPVSNDRNSNCPVFGIFDTSETRNAISFLKNRN